MKYQSEFFLGMGLLKKEPYDKQIYGQEKVWLI